MSVKAKVNPKTRAKRKARRLRTAARKLALYQLTELKRTDGETRHVTMRLPAKLLDKVQALSPGYPLSRVVAIVLQAGLNSAEVRR